jgi:hypothetical protein
VERRRRADDEAEAERRGERVARHVTKGTHGERV